MVGDKTITSQTYKPGSKINKDYFYNMIDRKFGYIYIMSDVPKEANTTVIVIRVTEVPFLWIFLGILIVLGTSVVFIIKMVKKSKYELDKNKLDIILNRLDK